MSSEKKHYISCLRDYLRTHIVLILILIIAAIVWNWVFNTAAFQFAMNGDQPLRSVWSGVGQFDLFGYTVYFDFEGYTDYDYYYYSWGSQFLTGTMPYTDLFNQILINGHLYNTPYFFPPLYVYMCAFGEVLPINPFGIGFIITLFGYLTALPVYGISEFLSKNRRVAEISALTYLLNPLVLFYTVFKWLNPAPFVFFMTLSFYLLMKNRRLSGALSMVTAALFKQTAFFFILPLLAFIIKRSHSSGSQSAAEIKHPVKHEFDLRGAAKIILVVAVYIIAVSMPYLFDLGNYLYYIFIRPGGMLLTNLTELPDVSQPISLAALLVFLGAPIPLIDIVNKATYYGIFLTFSSIVLFIVMLLKVKDGQRPELYWRRMFFLSLLLMFCVHLFSPRGIYKYYLVALVPFLSILSVSSMISGRTEKVKASVFMILNPILLGLLILVPNRYVYIGFLLLFLVGYLCHNQFSDVVGLLHDGLTQLDKKIQQILGIEDDSATKSHENKMISQSKAVLTPSASCQSSSRD